MPGSNPLAIIPSFVDNEQELLFLQNTVVTLRKTRPDLDILVVDDGSTLEPEILAPSMEKLSDDHGIQFTLKDDNEGFARTVNVGLSEALETGRDAILINADMTFFEGEWLDQLQQAEGDLIGGLLIYPSGLIQHAGIYYSLIMRKFDHIYRFAPARLAAAQEPRTCPVTGALQYIRHETLEEVGLYDEGYRLRWEDIDYCLRTFKKGLTCTYQPTCRALHYESVFTNIEDKQKEKWAMDGWRRLSEKHADVPFDQWVPTLLWEMRAES